MTGGLQLKLRAARERRGWTVSAATSRMGAVQDVTLWTLEGRNQHRAPAAGGEMKLKTAVAIAAAYWPDIALTDLMGPLPSLLSFKVRDARARRQIRRFYRPEQVPITPIEPTSPDPAS